MVGMATVLAAIALGGCATSGARGGSDAPGVGRPASAAPGPAGTPQRTSIATASQQDLAAAMRSNGVDDPEHWAKIVIQNRPYPPGEQMMTKLRQVLTSHHASPDTVQKILGALRA
jgi:hypothetical protein